MKNIALISNILILSSTGLFAQSHGELETLNARVNLNEAKIKQLESALATLKPEYKTTATAQAPATKKETKAATATSSYTVKKGDILTRIAYKHNTTVAEIKQANSLKGDSLSIGQKLAIPTSGSTKTLATKAPSKSAAKPTKHTTKQGETFYSIARLHKIKLNSLIAANPNVHPSRLSPGKVLIIDGNAKAAPKPQPKAVAKSTPTPKPAPAPKAQVASTPAPKPVAKAAVANTPAPKPATTVKEVTSSNNSGSSIRTITVYEQMTYGHFASKHGASTNQLNALNGLELSNNTMLAKGSELYVPQY